MIVNEELAINLGSILDQVKDTWIMIVSELKFKWLSVVMNNYYIFKGLEVFKDCWYQLS